MYATASMFLSFSITVLPISAEVTVLRISLVYCVSISSIIEVICAALTGRFLMALNTPLRSFCRSNASREPSFFCTMSSGRSTTS